MDCRACRPSRTPPTRKLIIRAKSITRTPTVIGAAASNDVRLIKPNPAGGAHVREQQSVISELASTSRASLHHLENRMELLWKDTYP